MGLMSKLKCLFRGHCTPKRQALGGFRCEICGKAGGDLDDMGFYGQGYTQPLRKLFSRKNNGTIERKHWD